MLLINTMPTLTPLTVHVPHTRRSKLGYCSPNAMAGVTQKHNINVLGKAETWVC